MLDGLQAEHDAAVDAGDFTAAFAVNGRFHRLINGGARNQEAVEIIDRHLCLIRALRVECGFTAQRMRAIREEHLRLIEAFRRNDDTAATRLSALHVRSSRDDLLSRLAPRLGRA
jgi:DNA-binding GntR family transcriptional regulator